MRILLIPSLRNSEVHIEDGKRNNMKILIIANILLNLIDYIIYPSMRNAQVNKPIEHTKS